jgi:hypothetical protein
MVPGRPQPAGLGHNALGPLFQAAQGRLVLDPSEGKRTLALGPLRILAAEGFLAYSEQLLTLGAQGSLAQAPEGCLFFPLGGFFFPLSLLHTRDCLAHSLGTFSRCNILRGQFLLRFR